jgi:hypothetical protein
MTTDTMPGIDTIKRTADGRPYIIPPDGGKPKPYTRVSTFARALEDGASLVAWKQRMAVKGAVEHPDLIPAGIDWTQPRFAAPVISTLMDAAGANDAAYYGTALHSLSEIFDFTDEDLRQFNPSKELLAGMDAYVEATKDIQMLEGEVFVVNDEYGCAGTLDRLMLIPPTTVVMPDGTVLYLPDGAVCIGDIKTGTLHTQENAIQMAMYAGGKRYDPVTGERTPLHPDLDTRFGIIIHVPRIPKPGVIPASLVGIDLTAGVALADLALEVRKSRSTKVVIGMNRERNSNG